MDYNERITIDDNNRKKINKYLKDALGLYDYDNDIAILQNEGQLTAKLAEKLIEDLMQDCQTTRDILEPNGEFKDEIEKAFQKFDSIPKPDNYEQYGYYEGSYDNMDLENVYNNILTCLEFKEVDNKHYETINYRKIADSVIDSVNEIEKYEIELQTNQREEIEEIKNQLESLLGNSKTDIRAIKEKVEQYNKHAIDIWNDYLSNVEEGKENDFRYLIHNMAKGEIKGDFRTKYMSTSLITNNAMGVFGDKSRYGLILRPKHIVSADFKDTYTNNYREDDEELFNIKPPIKLPQEIEEICIKQTIEANGEMLNYDNESIYSEIVIDEYEIEGIYYISNGEKELSPNYETAKRMAEERGIQLKELDISRCRSDNGLEPMTEKSQREFCRNILRKYCLGNQQLEDKFQENGTTFVQNHYKEFYEKYKELKDTGEYKSEDILKELKVVILDEDVKRWEMLGFYHSGFFTGELETEDLQYIFDSRFDFSKCNDFKEFEQLYSTFCNTLSSSILDDRLEKYISERFTNKEEILAMKDRKDELRKWFESGETSFENIVSEQPENEEDKQDDKEDKQQDVADKIQQIEDKTQIVKVFVNKYGEIIRPADNQVQIKEQEEQIQVGENTEEQVQKIRMTSSKELKDTKDVDMWLNRFKQWESCIDKLSANVKAKFIKIKSDIVNAISNRIKERNTKEMGQDKIEK